LTPGIVLGMATILLSVRLVLGDAAK